MRLHVSESAREQLFTLLTQQTEGPRSIRLFPATDDGGGCACSGPAFGMDLDEPTAGDRVVEVGQFTFIADAPSALLLDGASIDYEESLLQEGFSIQAPNAVLLGAASGPSAGCGCGGG